MSKSKQAAKGVLFAFTLLVAFQAQAMPSADLLLEKGSLKSFRPALKRPMESVECEIYKDQILITKRIAPRYDHAERHQKAFSADARLLELISLAARDERRVRTSNIDDLVELSEVAYVTGSDGKPKSILIASVGRYRGPAFINSADSAIELKSIVDELCKLH